MLLLSFAASTPSVRPSFRQWRRRRVCIGGSVGGGRLSVSRSIAPSCAPRQHGRKTRRKTRRLVLASVVSLRVPLRRRMEALASRLPLVLLLLLLLAPPRLLLLRLVLPLLTSARPTSGSSSCVPSLCVPAIRHHSQRFHPSIHPSIHPPVRPSVRPSSAERARHRTAVARGESCPAAVAARARCGRCRSRQGVEWEAFLWREEAHLPKVLKAWDVCKRSACTHTAMGRGRVFRPKEDGGGTAIKRSE